MEQPTLVHAHAPTCIRQDRLLFDALSFTVHAGDILHIQGDNGAGKTSLLRLIAGLSRPYEGHISFPAHQEQDIDHTPLMYIGHQSGIKPELSVHDNLLFYQEIHGATCQHIDQQLSHFNLNGFEESSANDISAGQKKRNALARLLHTNAQIWILDEPYTALDQAGIKRLDALFLRQVKQGGCLIFTTHQPTQVAHYEHYRVLKLS